MSQATPYADTLPRVDIGPLVSDCERDSVLVMVPFVYGGGAFSMWIVVAHRAGRFVSAEFPEGWVATMREHGYPHPDEMTERLLESLAWVRWLARSVGR